MATAKKKTQKGDYFASAAPVDNFGMVYESMCAHDCYKALSLSAKQFYTLCRVQARSKQGRACLYRYAETEGKNFADACFVFPATHQERFGIKRQNGSKYMNELIEAGFVKIVERNAHRHRPNVYQFDSKWKDSS